MPGPSCLTHLELICYKIVSNRLAGASARNLSGCEYLEAVIPAFTFRVAKEDGRGKLPAIVGGVQVAETAGDRRPEVMIDNPLIIGECRAGRQQDSEGGRNQKSFHSGYSGGVT